MKDNIFKSDRNQDGTLEDVHGDAFELIDTADVKHKKANTPEQDAMNAEMLLTIQEFSDRLDNVDCSTDE